MIPGLSEKRFPDLTLLGRDAWGEVWAGHDAARGLTVCDYEVVLKHEWQRNERSILHTVVNRLGFPVFGMLIIVSRHQADPNGLSGDSFVAAAGGICAFLVGIAFLVAACLHWRFCARRSHSPEDGRESVRNWQH